MTLRTIAVKNILRRKGKTALVVFGLAMAVATMVSVISMIQAFRGTVDEQLNEYGFNIVIFAKTKKMLIQYGDMTIGSVGPYKAQTLGRGELEKVASEAKSGGLIRGYSPKLLDVAKVKGKRTLLAGVDFGAERRIKNWWLIENGTYPNKSDEVFVGQTAAEKLGLAPGRTFRLYGSSLRVAGILMETGSRDDELIFADLEKLQSITGKEGQISLIEVAAGRTENVESLVKSLRSDLPKATVQSVKQAVELKANAVGYLTRFGLGITVIMTVISALIVFTMTASSVNERRAEIGIFRAVGFRRRQIAAIILTEAAMLGIVSGLIGYGIGFGLAELLPAVSRGAIAAVKPNPLLILAAVSLSVSIGLVSSLVPAGRAARLDPAQALKAL